MNLQHPIYLYLWVAPHVLLIAVAIVMYRRGLHREFPIFFSSLLYEFAQFCVYYPIYRRVLIVPAWLYLKLDTVGRAGSTAFHFGILQELFEWPVRHNGSLRQTSAYILKWVTAGLIVMTFAFIGFQYYRQSHRLPQSYGTLEALNITQCFVLALVFLWHRFLGLRMSVHVFGVALGLGLMAGLEPLIQAWKDSELATNLRIPDYLQMGVYHCTVLIWLAFAFARETVPRAGAPAQSEGLPLLEVRERAADLGRIARL